MEVGIAQPQGLRDLSCLGSLLWRCWVWEVGRSTRCTATGCLAPDANRLREALQWASAVPEAAT